MPRLFQWNLVLRHGVPLGVGIISGHPRLADGTYINTSPIFRGIRTGDTLILETASGSTYHLRMEEWSPSANEAEWLVPETLGLPPDFWTQCARNREAAVEKEVADLKLSCKPCTLFLRIVGTHILSAFWLDANAQGQGIPVIEHQGAFQDSYIITDAYQINAKPRQVDVRFFQDSYLITNTYQNHSEPHPVELRLFPKEDHLEPFRISPSVAVLQIRNVGRADVTFGYPGRKILCEAGKSALIPIQKFRK